MPNLFQIDNAINDLIDPETGEITDCEAFEALQMERPRKVEAVASAIRNYLADSRACSEQAAAFKERAEQYAARADRLTEYLSRYLDHTPFETPLCSVTFRKSQAVEVDELTCPAFYMRKKVKETFEPDKKAIKAAILEGQTVPGCKLVDRYNPTIK